MTTRVPVSYTHLHNRGVKGGLKGLDLLIRSSGSQVKGPCYPLQGCLFPGKKCLTPRPDSPLVLLQQFPEPFFRQPPDLGEGCLLYTSNCGRSLAERLEDGTYTLVINHITDPKMVRDRLAQFYREVLQDETYSAVLPDAILREAEAGVLSSHSVENMLLFPPVILITNASYTTVQRALKLLDHFAGLRSYPSDAGSDLEQLSKRSPVDDLSSREEPRREPLSFGAAVGAVILGLIVTVLLLSFL